MRLPLGRFVLMMQNCTAASKYYIVLPTKRLHIRVNSEFVSTFSLSLSFSLSLCLLSLLDQRVPTRV